MDHAHNQQALESLSAWEAAHEGVWSCSGEFETLLRATFARATKTYNAAVLLTAQGYGPQAAMLARSLFEDMLIAFWIVYGRPEGWAVRQFNERVEFQRLLARRLMDRLGWEVRPEEEFPADDRRRLEAERPRFEALFGVFGERSWWARDVRQRTKANDELVWIVAESRSLLTLVRQLDAASRDDDQRDAIVGLPDDDGGWSSLRRTYETINDFNNRLMHHSPTAIELHVQGPDGGPPSTWNTGPSVQWLPQASLALFRIYSQLIVLMSGRLAPELKDEVDDLVASTLARFGRR